MFFEKLSLVTGGFDPIHSGHIRYFERAKDFSDYLVVGLNGDPWLKRKKGQYFQCWTERADIVRHLNMVDAVVSWDDADDSACGAIEKCLDIADKVVFCNGGDRQQGNTPELERYKDDPRVIGCMSAVAVVARRQLGSVARLLRGPAEPHSYR